MNTPFAPRPHDAEAGHLAEDLRSLMRALHRMRPELQRHHAWLHVEAACQELSQARTRLMRGVAEGSTKEV